MHILWLIGKIIGIALLILLFIVLILIFAVLFIPIRYEAKGCYKKEIKEISAKITYAFPFVWLRIVYGEKKSAILRILGIKIKDFLGPKKDRSKKNTKSRRRKKNSHKKNEKAVEESTKDQHKVAQSQDISLEQDITHRLQEEDLEKQKMSFVERGQEIGKALYAKISHFCELWKRAGDDARKKQEMITTYLDIWQSEEFQQGFRLAKKVILKLLKSIRPRKGQLVLHIGTGDPASTGQICGFYGMIYPFVGKYVILNPEFSDTIYEGEFYLKGRIYGIVFIKVLLIALFHKDLRYIRKMILK